MTRVERVTRIGGLAGWIILAAAGPAFGQYIPDKFFAAMYTDFGDMSSSLNHPFFEHITPIPDQYVIEETDIVASFPPVSEEGGEFERNEHVVRFATDGETSDGQSTGHKFQRREAWDFAFDVKIETPRPDLRKEAGLYLRSSAVGNSLFYAGTNTGSHYAEEYPGDISSVFDDILPTHSFSGAGGILGDYNGNGTVDAADYTIWRDTLGSDEDFRANGNNEGASEDFIDMADYEVWKTNFGQSSEGGTGYTEGDTLRMRFIYTPPELDDPEMPDVANDPNVVTPGTIEYLISLNGGPVESSGPLEITNDWQGIPNDTLIMLRAQNLSTASAAPDSATTTFSNFDFNGDLPGTGLEPAPGGLVGGVPEPGSALLAAVALGAIATMRRRH